MRITIHMPTLYNEQRAAFFNDARISICEACTKAGKTVGAIAWQFDQAVTQFPGASHVWVAPIFAQAHMAFNRMNRFLSRMDPMKETGWEVNKSEMIIQTPGGSRVFYKGSDNPDSIYGPDYASAVVDEASRCKEEAWHAIRSTTTSTKGKIRIIGNIKGRKNWAYRLARKAEAGEPDMRYMKITAEHAVAAGIMDAAEVEDARRVLPAHVFGELFMCQPADDGGNPFSIAAIHACVGGRSTSDPVAFGVDLAKSQDWTWVIGLDAAGRQCVSERWQGDWGATRRRVLSIVGDTPAVIDSTGVGDPIVEDLQREQRNIVGFKFTSGSKQQLMEGLASAIQQRNIGFYDPQLISELESFEYEYTRTGARYAAPEGSHDDGVCALALAVKCFHEDRPELGVALVDVNGSDEDWNEERHWR